MTQFYISYFSEFATVLWYTIVKVIRDLLIFSIFKCMRLTTHFARSVTSVESQLNTNIYIWVFFKFSICTMRDISSTKC